MQTLEDDDSAIEYIEENDSSEERSVVSKKMVKEVRISSVFGLSAREKIIKTFPCFLVAEILIQGTMVLTERHICFYSNIPGIKRNIKIQLSLVTEITKEKVYAFFPTGIGIRTLPQKTTFSYVTSRDKLLQLLRSRWQLAIELDNDESSLERDLFAEESQAPPAASDCQVASSDNSAINDEDSGIALSPDSDSTDESDIADERAALPDSETVDADADASPSLTGALRRSFSSDSLQGGRALAAVLLLLALSAAAIIILSIRLQQLQHQMLLLIGDVGFVDGRGASDSDLLHFRLGGLLQSLTGLQQKLTVVRDSLHRLPVGESGAS